MGGGGFHQGQVCVIQGESQDFLCSAVEPCPVSLASDRVVSSGGRGGLRCSFHRVQGWGLVYQAEGKTSVWGDWETSTFSSSLEAMLSSTAAPRGLVTDYKEVLFYRDSWRVPTALGEGKGGLPTAEP